MPPVIPGDRFLIAASHGYDSHEGVIDGGRRRDVKVSEILRLKVQAFLTMHEEDQALSSHHITTN